MFLHIRSCAPLVLLLLAAALTPDAVAQATSEITPVVSWVVGGSGTVPNGRIHIDNGIAYGVVFGTKAEKNVNAEFAYSLFPTQGHFNPSSGSNPVTLDMTVHYLQFGAAYHALTGSTQPFIATGCGVALFRPNGGAYGHDLRFAVSATVGVKVFPQEHIGLRLQARVYLPVYFSRGGFWGDVGGTGGGLNGGVRMVQGDLGAGIIVAF